MTLKTKLVWEGVDIQRFPWKTTYNNTLYYLRVSFVPTRGQPGWLGSYQLAAADRSYTPIADRSNPTKTQHFDSIKDDVVWVQDALSWAEDLLMTPMDLLVRGLAKSE